MSTFATVSLPISEMTKASSSALTNVEFQSPMTVKQILSDCEDSFIGLNVTISGRLTRFKYQGSFMFGAICDGSEHIGLQFVYSFTNDDKTPKEVPKDILDFATTATPGSSVTITGTVVKSPAKGQAVEVAFESGSIFSVVRDLDQYQYGSSMAKKKTGSLEWNDRMVMIRPDIYGRFRDKVIQSIMRIRGKAKTELHVFFQKHDFVHIDTPIITKSDCEGAGEMFRVTSFDMKTLPVTDKGDIDYSKDFFATQANLSVSGQLEAESLAQTLSKVYTFGPTFRAEHSNTPRHLAEFWMLEPELVFTDTDTEERFSRLLDLEESMIKHVIEALLSSSISDLQHLSKTISPELDAQLTDIARTIFARITYTEAISILTSAVESGTKFEESAIVWGMDLGSEHERFICEQIFQKPVFVTHYPQDLKSFYMKADAGCPDNRRTCQAVDLLIPGIGELCGGSMREDDPEKLKAVMEKKGVPLTDLQWYVDLRYDGGLPTGGFGLGFERLVRLLTGSQSIKDVIPFPRYPKHI